MNSILESRSFGRAFNIVQMNGEHTPQHKRTRRVARQTRERGKLKNAHSKCAITVNKQINICKWLVAALSHIQRFIPILKLKWLGDSEARSDKCMKCDRRKYRITSKMTTSSTATTTLLTTTRTSANNPDWRPKRFTTLRSRKWIFLVVWLGCSCRRIISCQLPNCKWKRQKTP